MQLTIEDARLLTLYIMAVGRWIEETQTLCKGTEL